MFNTIGKLHVKLALYPSLKRLPVDRFLLNLLMPTFCMLLVRIILILSTDT